MIKNRFSLGFLALFIVVIFSCKSKQAAVQEISPPPPPNSDMTEKAETTDALVNTLLLGLTNLEGVTAERIESQNEFYNYMFELQIEQPVDHFDVSKGTFKQKVYLSHLDFNKPMVMYLNGYTAGSNSYVTEAAQILESNQIHVEHRFFSNSRPETIPWDLLTIEQSAYDHHRIVELLKTFYTKPWVSTGISKGGMVTIFHKRFFPNDVAVAMPYVAPLNTERHDPRVYEHLNNVGTEECRNAVTEYQRELLIYRDEALDIFEKYSDKAGYVYPHGLEASFELSVLEFSFAFWQWSGDCSTIPSQESSVEDKMKYLFYTIDAPSFFNESTLTDILPFFYQGYYEIGMYGYEVDKFKGLTQIYTEEVDNYRTFIPKDMDVIYNPEPVRDVINWLDENGNNMIFIYGELDPWGATAYEPTANTNSLFLNLDNGNHGTRLKNFPKDTRAAAMDSLQIWISRR
ncbi:MAG: hypothetical protein ACI9EA_000262 [Pseudomonadales bacterium]|jgi:hypothetical protein